MSVQVLHPVFTCDRCGATAESVMSEQFPSVARVPSGWDQWMNGSGYLHLCPDCTGEPADFLAPPTATVDSRVEIDLNVRLSGSRTVVGFSNVEGSSPRVGDRVGVHESESGYVGTATVIEVNPDQRLVYLVVDWSSLSVT